MSYKCMICGNQYDTAEETKDCVKKCIKKVLSDIDKSLPKSQKDLLTDYRKLVDDITNTYNQFTVKEPLVKRYIDIKEFDCPVTSYENDIMKFYAKHIQLDNE